ncbi:MAG: isocitrate/isopropylmalate dehydrogenase family protein [Planctomycetaceae bacterium]|jgi:isocitrate dehydrogenase (NAD+)|nr:isocitrate/isopropylmalate dehydrogenase family protein [Planctomycetaceae bacterium]
MIAKKANLTALPASVTSTFSEDNFMSTNMSTNDSSNTNDPSCQQPNNTEASLAGQSVAGQSSDLSASKEYDVTLITGDGVGPELASAARRCIDATGVKIRWDEQEAGVDVMEKTGTPLPDSVLQSVRRTKCALKAPITTPVGMGFRSINVHLRQEFDLFACVRPCKSYSGVRTYFYRVPVDIVIFRENTEDLYAGIEFERGKTDEIINVINSLTTGRQILTPPSDTGISIKPISVFGTERIVRAAFDYAVENRRKKVTAVHKANIMKHTDGLFLEVSRQVAQEYPQIEFEDKIVDNICMQLVQKPELYDVLVLPNLYGDILSDLCAGLVGGLGVAPGANIGKDSAIFEATHGSAPKYKGQNKVNPTALILSGMLMLKYLNEHEAAKRLEDAVAAVIKEGKFVTFDLKNHRNDPKAVGTNRMADAIIKAMN